MAQPGVDASLCTTRSKRATERLGIRIIIRDACNVGVQRRAPRQCIADHHVRDQATLTRRLDTAMLNGLLPVSLTPP